MSKGGMDCHGEGAPVGPHVTIVSTNWRSFSKADIPPVNELSGLLRTDSKQSNETVSQSCRERAEDAS